MSVKIITPSGIGYEGEKFHPSATRPGTKYNERIRLTMDEELSERHSKSLPLIRNLEYQYCSEENKRQKVIDNLVKEYRKKGGERNIFYEYGDRYNYSDTDEGHINVDELNKLYDNIQVLLNNKYDFKPKNKKELIELIIQAIEKINENNEDIFFWSDSIDFDIFDSNLRGFKHRTINVKPSDIKELKKFGIELERSNLVIDEFKNYLSNKSILFDNLNKKQWIYLLTEWYHEKIDEKNSSQLESNKWYLPKCHYDNSYDDLINYYQIEFLDIKNQLEHFIYNSDPKHNKSKEIINNIFINLRKKEGTIFDDFNKIQNKNFTEIKEIEFNNYWVKNIIEKIRSKFYKLEQDNFDKFINQIIYYMDYENWCNQLTSYFFDNEIKNDHSFDFRPPMTIYEQKNHYPNVYKINNDDIEEIDLDDLDNILVYESDDDDEDDEEDEVNQDEDNKNKSFEDEESDFDF